MKHHRTILIVSILHVALAIGYALLTPYREGGRILNQRGAYAADIGAPDERQHANYVARIAQGQGIPVFDPKDPNLYETYQAHQPPAYYLLAGGVAKATGGSDLTTRAQGLPVRFLNALIGGATVFGIYCFVLWGFRNERAARAAAVFAALLPMNAALSGAISNDPMLFALCSWTLALAAKGIREGFNYKLAGGVGLLMGLAFVTKTTAIALAPAVAVGFAASRPTKSDIFRYGGLALLVAIAFGVPWWLRNQSLYGDPLAISAFGAAFTGSPQASEFIQWVGPADYWITGAKSGTGVAWWTLRSFFGVFGYMDIFMYGSLYGVLALAFAGLVVVRFGLSKRIDEEQSKPIRWMGGLFFFVVAALFLRFNAQYFQGQARYLFPALAPIAATVGLAMATLAGKVRKGHESRALTGTWTLAAVLAVLNLYALMQLPGEFENRIGPPPTAIRAELDLPGMR